MKAFLLAAGLGERLRPVTGKRPKPLVPVMNVPVVCFAIMLLIEAGISEIVCNLHYMGGSIIDYLKDSGYFGLDIRFSEEEEILGTGGGLYRCMEEFKEPFVLINSDIITDIDLSGMISAWNMGSVPSVLALHSAAGSSGGATVSVKGDRIIDFKNALGTGCEPVFDYMGMAVLDPSVFSGLVQDNSSIVYTGYTSLVKDNSLGYYEHRGEWYDIGKIESYRNACLSLLQNEDLRKRLYRATGKKAVAVADTAQIHGSAEVTGSVIGHRCRVGHSAVIENSVLLPGAVVGDGEVIRQQVIV